jgi:hypothetical protein
MVGLNSTLGMKAAGAAAKIARDHLGWSEGRVQQELAGYQNAISRFLLSDE